MIYLSDMWPGKPPGHGGTHWSSSSSHRRNWVSSFVQNNGDHRETEILRVRQFMSRRIHDHIVQWASHSYDIQANSVHEVVMCLEETLFESAASEEEYMNQDTLASRIEVQLRRLVRHRQQSLQDNGASNSRMESTSNVLHFMPSSSVGTSLFSSSMVNSTTPTNFSAEGLLPSDSAPFVGFISEDHQEVDSSMSGIRRFPNQMISECSTTANCYQSNMPPDSLFPCNGIATTESKIISNLNALQKPAQSRYIGGQNDLIMQSFSFSYEDQTPEYLDNFITNRVRNIHSNMVHANGSNVSAKKFIQTAYCEPEQLHFDQYQQTGDRYELFSIAPSVFGNHYGSTSSRVWLKNDCNSDSSVMHMQSQSKLGSSLMPHYLSLPHPEEAAAIQCQVINKPGNVNCPLPLSDTQGQLSRYDVQLDSQYQPQQNYALGMLETTSVNVHNEVSFRNYAEYPQQSESQHQANEKDPSVQVLHLDQLSQESETEYKYVDSGMQPKEVIHSLQEPEVKPDMSGQPCLQVGSYNNFKKRDVIQLKKVSKEECVASETAFIESTNERPLSRDANCTSKDLSAKSIIMKKNQVFLCWLCHAHSCIASAEGKCPHLNCVKVKKLLSHMADCKVYRCSFPKCQNAKVLISHFRQCRDPCCPVCAPIKNQLTLRKRTLHTCEYVQPQPKRAKTDLSEVCLPSTEKPLSGVSTDCKSHSAECLRTLDDQHGLIPTVKHEVKKLNGGSPEDCKDNDTSCISFGDSKIDTWPHDGSSVDDLENTQEYIKSEEELLQTSAKLAALPAEPVSESIAHSKVDCVSLTELFTPEQVRQHVISLRQWVGQSKEKADKRQAMEQSMNQNSCELCAAEELNFEPMPVYCTQCGSRIRRHAVYYMLATGDTRYYFCTTCHTAMRGENFAVYGRTFSKSEVEKKKNNEQIQEPWVQCDKCHGWQHQICALFNSRMNGEGQAKYTCPNCYVMAIERGDRLALPKTAFLGAKDLPRTTLSDHIERRLHRRLQEDIQQRATAQGLVDEKVPDGGALVVRVVLSVDKKLEVKKNFRDIFHDYPAEFPYKSKVILLFQDIEGVEVCLFGMYVQEFGSECDFPNRRRIYISYLDSVKYFRPDVKVVTGEALRTFIYHEVLIGYLETCKNRGFTSCYIWVCPPLKGEDYILYCHPEIQRTPKSDKLREWYLSMLKKASKEDIVVEITNLYDHFLVSTGESKANITATRLPYFDGDYWPGAAEEKLQQFCQEGDKEPSKKSASKKSFTKRSLRTTLHSDISDSASKDMFLIHEIGKTISPMKEDFIMVHLHYACTHCCMFIISGNCWLCKQCSNFRLCDRCYEAEQCRDERDRHPLQQRIKHLLHPIKILNVPLVTKDEDEIIESEIFDTRHAFLNLCQGNHYQYDTLRRAKHSSMMLLYHLHNPTAPAFVAMCNICHLDIEAGHGLRCEVCFDYEICSGCYEKHGGHAHPHKLTKRSSTQYAQSKEARASWASQVRKMNDLIVHVSDCHSPSCLYSDCRKVKWLFRHGTRCTKRALKGCVSCKKMWYLLQIHSRACQESKCHVPRCSDLKMHTRRLQLQSESRRRAAVTEMFKQRTAGVGPES